MQTLTNHKYWRLPNMYLKLIDMANDLFTTSTDIQSNPYSNFPRQIKYELYAW